MPDKRFIKDLKTFDGWMEGIITSLSPARRRVLFRTIAKDLRQSNQKRITKQTDPDGNVWDARKSQGGKAEGGDNGSGQVRKKKKMMMGLRTARRMKFTGDADGAEVGFSGRNAKIAAVHHLGGMDFVDPESTTKVRYPIRQLLGLTKNDHSLIHYRVLDHLQSGLS
jgi:phage virion morphogenesis protein